MTKESLNLLLSKVESIDSDFDAIVAKSVIPEQCENFKCAIWHNLGFLTGVLQGLIANAEKDKK